MVELVRRTGMNERSNGRELTSNRSKVPVRWDSAEPFYPNIRICREPQHGSTGRLAFLPGNWLSRTVIVLTAILMALVFLSGKPCALKSTEIANPRPMSGKGTANDK